ncbi:amino acid ABC transporter [Klebsiella michiganensis]|uniref:Amino acid ABC transporter n=1 Tax=Klebsiella michiganensis TaxID=1134687 RepID=A0A7H4PRE2_9ENTR|nr:amino acid ABC transporter [Klebsiella michiganensis]
MAANQQENKFSIVDIRNLHKHFGQNHVLNGVDLQIARGEIVSIIGQSGLREEYFTTVHQWPGELSVRRTAGRKRTGGLQQ